MRFGHAGLNSTLCIIVKHSTGDCDYGGEQDTIIHVFEKCEKYSAQRRQIIQNLKTQEETSD